MSFSVIQRPVVVANYHATNITGLMFTQQLFDNKIGLVAGMLNSLDLVQGILPDIGSGRESFLNVNALVTALPWFRYTVHFVVLDDYHGVFRISEDIKNGTSLTRDKSNVQYAMPRNGWLITRDNTPLRARHRG